ncbi:MAG: ABC transporter ATP-binding protein [Bdellovibrionaceae bacterium]|nr:ABC transporter ATP-binding protein [Pseudobdellovibrionaceae bacterium]
MLEVKGLNKKYGSVHAVKDLSFKLEKGERLGFLGSNGAGKTTTMQIIAGALAPSSGVVTVGGYDVFENPQEVKKQIGYLPEIPPVYEDMRVLDYLKYVAQLKGITKASLALETEEVIGKTHLESVAGRYIQHLSKGFRQRVGLAQALLGNPPLLILDEPTVGLDPQQIIEIRELIQNLKGHSVLLSSHILSEVQNICTKAIIIKEGQIVLEDNIQDLIHKGSSSVVSLRLSGFTAQIETQLLNLPYVNHCSHKNNKTEVHLKNASNELLIELSKFLVNSKVGLIEQSLQDLKLENIFIELTK